MIRASASALAASVGGVLLLAGCTSGASPASPASSESPAPESGPASTTPMETADILDLCETVPKDEITPVLDAYGFTDVTLRSTTDPGDQPVCTLTSAAGGTIRLHLVDTAFTSYIDGKLGPEDAPPENGAVWLPDEHTFAATADDSTLLVTDESATAATPAVLFLSGTALDGLP